MKRKDLIVLNCKPDDILKIDRIIVRIYKKEKISLSALFQKYQGDNLVKEFAWDENVGKEIW